MPNRESALRNLAVGDIFHAASANGASLICLITSLTNNEIQAVVVTTQVRVDFDRQTGDAKWEPASTTCAIDSIARLPPEINQTLLNLDLRYRAGGDPKLLPAEKRALVFVDTFYMENPL